MSIKTEEAKQSPVIQNSFEANVSLAAMQYRFVDFVSGSSGRPKVGLPAGDTRVAGVLQNAPAAGALAEVTQLGETILEATGAFNNGIELTSVATTGKAVAAGAGDYVGAIALEAASAAGHLIRALVVTPYQKN